MEFIAGSYRLGLWKVSGVYIKWVGWFLKKNFWLKNIRFCRSSIDVEQIEQEVSSHEKTKMFNEQVEAHLEKDKLVMVHVTL